MPRRWLEFSGLRATTSGTELEKVMSPDAAQSLQRLAEWLGELGMGQVTDTQIHAALDRWQRGEEPPIAPCTKEWPKPDE
jgi:hypothetical protein